MTLLKGIRVVEMGLWVAGPAAAGILADWGAEVIKIEMPKGDPMRKLFGALSGSKEDRCPPFDLYNRGKKSIALDINHTDGAALVQQLVATADVFITNMRPQFLERIGLDHAALLAKHPRLVYASLTAYGLEGPDRDAPGYDMAAYSGRTGLADRATPPGASPPVLPGGLGGMDVSTRVGLGRISAAPSRTKPQNPLMNSYCASDSKWFWIVGAESERHWPGIARALGDVSLMEDARFASPRERRRNSEALVLAIEALTARHTRQEWADIFKQHDVWWAPINSVDDLMTDPQVLASGAFVHVPVHAGQATPESFNGVATPVDFSATPSRPAGPPPGVGADADALLSELGIDDAELQRLRDTAVLA
jgi:crotonobetainyl-CoA:carnitine CoA-transferase CaiB-like acyl-CoA transferase